MFIVELVKGRGAALPLATGRCLTRLLGKVNIPNNFISNLTKFIIAIFNALTWMSFSHKNAKMHQ